MMLGPLLAVVFAGIVGGSPKVDRQVKAIAHDLHLKPVALSPQAVRTLTHHSAKTRAVVKKLGVDGVIACEVTGTTLSLVVYDGTGAVKTFLQIDAAKEIAADDLDMLRTNLESDVGSLSDAKAPPADDAAIEMDTPASAPEAGSPKPEPPSDGETISAADIEALTSSAEPQGAARTVAESLHLGADVGFGIAARNFAPGPSTLAAYSSSPVGAVHLAAHVQPTARLELAVGGERTLQMSTSVRDGMATTSITRWEAIASYQLVRGTVEIASRAGVGHRGFAIDSTDPARSPDGDYNYLVAGVTAASQLGAHVRVVGLAAFEPVISGVEPTEAAFGEAARWALDVGAAVELRGTHVFARLAADYQRFAWSWDMAGARGAGGAVDAYPSGTLSLGATY